MSSSDLKAIPTFIEKAVKHAFQVQLGTTVKPADKTMDSKILSKYSIDCMSTLIMTSKDHVSGSLSIGFPKSTFLKLVEKMLGEVTESITPETSDAASEVLNIIYSSSRKEINESGFTFEMAIPSTVIGTNLGLSRSNMLGTLLLTEYTSDLGSFFVILSLELKQLKKIS